MGVTAILDEVQKLNDEERTDFVVGMVGHMSVGNMTKLVQTIEKKFDVTATGGIGQIITNPQQTTTPTVVEEKTEFTILLKAADASKKISLIKEVRAITALGLKEAKDLVDGAPRPVKSGVPKADAEAAKKRLEDAGGVVELT